MWHSVATGIDSVAILAFKTLTLLDVYFSPVSHCLDATLESILISQEQNCAGQRWMAIFVQCSCQCPPRPFYGKTAAKGRALIPLRLSRAENRIRTGCQMPDRAQTMFP